MVTQKAFHDKSSKAYWYAVTLTEYKGVHSVSGVVFEARILFCFQLSGRSVNDWVSEIQNSDSKYWIKLQNIDQT